MTQSFTRETIIELRALTQKVADAKEHASELLRIAQDRHNDKVHTLVREGKEIQLKEKTLWDEVFYLGTGSQAGKILAKEHPEVFEAYKAQDVAADELKKFCILELGVDYTHMTLSDYLHLTETMFAFMLKEYKVPHEVPAIPSPYPDEPSA